MNEIGGEELVRAADVLVNALRVVPGERFAIVGDADSIEIMAVLEHAGRAARAEVATLRLDELKSYATNHSGDRPHRVLPDAVRRAMLAAQASVFVASAPRAEQSMRDQLQMIVGACRIRHAHLPGITASAFAAGVRLDHEFLVEPARSLLRLLDGAREITCTSAAGTNLVIRPGARRWVPRVGRVEPGESVMFPAGSLLVSPEEIRGTFAANASVGEHAAGRDRLLRAPVFFDIEDGSVRAVRSDDGTPELLGDIEGVLAGGPNSDRVGLVILGLNRSATQAIGSVAVDQHRPGLHLVIGDPQSKLTAAGWSARTSLVVCQEASSVYVDGVLVAEGGRVVV